ncbi:MAG: hypothetical protein CM1200mP34_3610 [Verrucomicrobiales bacterium]|nr:MAG: hypothetical protein CM1200mP34_3610 [Verrucomicrobiales bacterium]
MKFACFASLILSLGLCACGGLSNNAKDKKPETEESTSSGNPLTAPVDYIGAVGKAKKSSGKKGSTSPTSKTPSDSSKPWKVATPRPSTSWSPRAISHVSRVPRAA